MSRSRPVPWSALALALPLALGGRHPLRAQDGPPPPAPQQAGIDPDPPEEGPGPAPPRPPETFEPARPPAPAGEALRDPTRAGALGPLVGGGGRSLSLPEMRLRGRVLRRGRAPAALLEIGGRLHLVRVGDEITLEGGQVLPGGGSAPSGSPAAEPIPGDPPESGAAAPTTSFRGGGGRGLTAGGVTLRVVSLDERELRVEFARFNQTITVR